VRLSSNLLSPAVRLVSDLPDSFRSAAFVSKMVLTDEAIGFASRFDHYENHVSKLESDAAEARRERGPAR